MLTARRRDECLAIEHRHPLAAKLHPAALLEAAQEAAYDLSHAAEIVGELLMGRFEHRTAVDEQLRQPRVEPAKRDFLDHSSITSLSRAPYKPNTYSRNDSCCTISSLKSAGGMTSTVTSDSAMPDAV